MNWRRIWSGTCLAGLAVAGIGYLTHHVILGAAWQSLLQAGRIRMPQPYIFPLMVIQDFVIGFILMWLYALARPRLGPGPKTATVTALLAWFLFSVPSALRSWAWFALPSGLVWIALLGGFAQCWIGSYLAGWQYMEKAP